MLMARIGSKAVVHVFLTLGPLRRDANRLVLDDFLCFRRADDLLRGGLLAESLFLNGLMKFFEIHLILALLTM